MVGATTLMHGKTSTITHEGVGVFAGLPSPITATRYHSLTLAPESMPAELEVTAVADDGTIMGVRHRHLPVEGVQFHPESILTSCGHDLLANFLARCTPLTVLTRCSADRVRNSACVAQLRAGWRPAARSGSSTRRASSAGSTPSSTTTSMIERPLSRAVCTIAAARSYPISGLSAVASADVRSA